MRKLIVLIFALATFAQAQFVNLPDNTPYVFEWNKLHYSTTLHAHVVRGRINPCGDPFTNATFTVDTLGNISAPIQWSGGGARTNGSCVLPIVLPNPTNNTPGDRHPFYGTTYSDTWGGMWMFDGVEDFGKCTGEIPGTCAYQDMWFLNMNTQVWTKLAKPPYNAGVYNANIQYVAGTDKIYSVGGIIGGNNSGKIAVYDPNTDTWAFLIPTGATMSPRNGVGLVDMGNGQLLIFGGQINGGGTSTETFLLDTNTNILTKLNPAHTFGAGSACARFPKAAFDTLRDRVVMYCGDSGVWVFDPVAIDWSNQGFFGGPGLPAGNYPGMQTMDYNPEDDSFMLEQGNGAKPFWKIPASQIPGGPSPLTFDIPAACLHGKVGQPFIGCKLVPRNGVAPYTFFNGELPSGLVLNADGSITGTPAMYADGFGSSASVRDSQQ